MIYLVEMNTALLLQGYVLINTCGNKMKEEMKRGVSKMNRAVVFCRCEGTTLPTMNQHQYARASHLVYGAVSTIHVPI